jgi:hypothetical protein
VLSLSRRKLVTAPVGQDVAEKPVDPVLPEPAAPVPAEAAIGEDVTAADAEIEATPAVGGSGAVPVAEEVAATTKDATIDPPSTRAAPTPRIEDVVCELPPIPLKRLVFNFMCGDGWKQTETPQAEEREQEVAEDESRPEPAASTSEVVSTRALVDIESVTPMVADFAVIFCSRMI